VLEPADRILLYTDGVVEGRDEQGRFFGVDRLSEMVARETASGQLAPETLRRLARAILSHQGGELTDDATTVFVEWRGEQGRLLPTDP
jgi:serine phosphatase RsbU (regulator of sigma subunit)